MYHVDYHRTFIILYDYRATENTTGASFIVITHFKNMNTAMVIAMATNEIAMPTFPMMSNARLCGSEIEMGLALSKMAKWVRWLQLQTVWPVVRFLTV